MNKTLLRVKKTIETRKELSLSAMITDTKNLLLKENRKKAIKQLVITFLISIVLSSLLVQAWELLSNRREYLVINPFTLIYKALTSGKLLTLIFLFMINVGYMYLKIIFHKQTTKDDRNFDVSESGAYGTSNMMQEDEFNATFHRLPPEETIKNILGKDIKNQKNLVSLRHLQGINDHKIIIGASGSRKSRSQAVPDIFQYIKRGESFIATDPKGELYKMTAAVAAKHGYNVKIFNLKPEEMRFSDGCDFLKVVGSNTLMAQTVADIMIKNTSGDGKGSGGFWDDGAKSLLTSCILYISMSDNLRPEEKTLGEMYNMLTENTPVDLEKIFMGLERKHPARRSYNLFRGGNDNAKAGTWQGLGVRLQTFQDDIVQKVCSTDEISFTAPGVEKCAYYVIMSDQEDTMNFIASLFFSLLFIRLVGFADTLPGMKLPITTNFLLDEFPNIGQIPSFDKKQSTVRSRGINITIICQNIGQLKDKYNGSNMWSTLISNCGIQMLLATNEQDTATFFSKRSGEMTINVKSKKYDENITDLFKLHPNYAASEGLGKRTVYTADELMTMDDNECLICVQGRHVTKLIKYDLSEHEYAKEMEVWNAANHLSVWQRKSMTVDEIEDFAYEHDQVIQETKMLFEQMNRDKQREEEELKREEEKQLGMALRKEERLNSKTDSDNLAVLMNVQDYINARNTNKPNTSSKVPERTAEPLPGNVSKLQRVAAPVEIVQTPNFTSADNTNKQEPSSMEIQALKQLENAQKNIEKNNRATAILKKYTQE